MPITNLNRAGFNAGKAIENVVTLMRDAIVTTGNKPSLPKKALDEVIAGYMAHRLDMSLNVKTVKEMKRLMSLSAPNAKTAKVGRRTDEEQRAFSAAKKMASVAKGRLDLPKEGRGGRAGSAPKAATAKEAPATEKSPVIPTMSPAEYFALQSTTLESYAKKHGKELTVKQQNAIKQAVKALRSVTA